MENQVENSACAPNPKGLIVLIGVIFGALISFTANETFLSIIGGAVVGLVIAGIIVIALIIVGVICFKKKNSSSFYGSSGEDKVKLVDMYLNNLE